MENLSTQANFRRKTASVVLCLLLGGSSVLALAPAAVAVISVDDVSPTDGAISISNPYMAMGANISGTDRATVGIATATQWLQGDLGTSLTVGSTGALELRNLSREDFSGSGDPDDTVWYWNDNAVQGGGSLGLSSDVGSGVDSTRIDHMSDIDFRGPSSAGITVIADITVLQLDAGVGVIAIGWWGSDSDWDGIMVRDNGSGGVKMFSAAMSPLYGYREYSGAGQIWDVPYGQTIQYQVTFNGLIQSDQTQGTYNMSATNLATGSGYTFFPPYNDVQNYTQYHVFSGAPSSVGGDFALDIDDIRITSDIRASAGTYESAPIDTGLYPGAFVSRVNLTTSNGQFNGIGAVLWRTAPNDTGPWSSYSTAPVNVPVDMAASTWIQIQISLNSVSNPSWPTAISFEMGYRLDVGAYLVDDLPGSGNINTDVWTASSTAVTGEGLDLDSASGSASVGVTYKNSSWLLSDSHQVKTLTAIRVMSGDSLGSGGGGDGNMLLSGFTATDGSAQTGYVGVVRLDDGVDAYWGVAWDDGSGRRTDMRPQNLIQTSGQAMVLATLTDGVFHAWTIEADNAWRGWLDLGSFDWGATPGTASWRIGDIGSHSGAQRAILDWAAIQLKPLTPVFGTAWTAGNVNINENQNTRAVIALNGPTWSMQLVNYRLDTVAPSGTEMLNGGNAYTQTLAVALDLTATDLWGVSQYAASESLSFPEGWKPMTPSASFSLSPGDGRKVVWVRFQDSSGVASNPINQSVVLDSQNPSGAIYVDNRSSYTNTIDVPVTMLAFDGAGVDMLYLSNSANMSNAVAFDVNPGTAPTSSSETRTWSLTPGDGVKTVFFQVMDVSGRKSSIYNDSILVDTTAPSLAATITNGVARNGTTYVNTNSLHINVEASDASGVHDVDIAEDASFATFKSYTGAGALTYEVPSVSGAKSVWVRAFDVYGLQSPVRKLDFFVDVNAPTGSIEILYTGQSKSDFLLNIQGCCNSTTLAKARGVVLVVTAVDNVEVTEVQFSTSLYFPGAVWQPFHNGRYFDDLSANDGTDKTMYVRFRDINGNPSQAFFDQIDMDTTAPVGSIIVNSGDVSTIDPLLSLSLEGSDNFEGDLQMRLSLTPDFNGSTWLPFSDSQRFDARTTAGEVTVYYQVRDANGWESLTYSDKISVRPPTCQELNNCNPIGNTPGFEGAYSALALVAVAAALLVARRRQAK